MVQRVGAWVATDDRLPEAASWLSDGDSDKNMLYNRFVSQTVEKSKVIDIHKAPVKPSV